jgi:hypothetical protein
MSRETRLIHFTIIDGTIDEIKELKQQLSKIGKKLSYDLEFIITNDKIESIPLERMLKSLMDLYKQKKKVK